MSHYDILGLKPDATPEEVQQAFRRAASAAHPDKGGSTERMQLVNRAADVLRDPDRRSRYDKTGRDTEEPSLEQSAAQALGEMFEQAISSGARDILAATRRKLHERKGQIASVKAEATTRRGSLVKRSGVVKTKDGAPNLVQKIIDRQIKALDQQLAQIEQVQQIEKMIEKMLAAYAGGEIDESQPLRDMQSLMQSAMAQSQYSGGIWGRG